MHHLSCLALLRTRECTPMFAHPHEQANIIKRQEGVQYQYQYSVVIFLAFYCTEMSQKTVMDKSQLAGYCRMAT